MNIRFASPGRRPLATALCAALLVPGAAFAQVSPGGTAREQALEARIAELERQVQRLVEAQRPPAAPAPVAAVPPPTTAPSPRAAGPAAAAPAPVRGPIQLTTITPGAAPGTTFKFGGFIKADFLSTRTSDGTLADGAVGRYLYIPLQTPVGGGRASGVDTDFHAKFSRFNLGVDTVTDGGDKLSAFIELDFFGNALATQVNNLYGGTLRHAYFSWNQWLAGQTWSNFMDINNFPESADILGPTDGILFSRQAQIRYTRGRLSLSAENPETLVTAYQGGSAVVASDRGAMPDLTGRYTWKGDWGNFGVAAIARQFRTRTAASNDTVFGGAVSVGGRWVFNARNDLRYQLTYGEGIARYLGFGNGSDVEADLNGNLRTIGTLAGWVGWHHVYTSRLRSTVMYARADYDHALAYAGEGATKTQQSVRANLFYSPLPKLDLGAEVMYGRREIESGDSGDISRLQFTTRYSF